MTKSAIGACLLLLGVQQSLAHPACLPGYTQIPASEITNANGQYCGEMKDSPLGMCCDPGQEQALHQIVTSTMPAGASTECQALWKQVECTACDPWALHLHAQFAAEAPVPLLCADFCKKVETACNLPPSYCQEHASTTGYCYPFDETTNGAGRTGTGIFPYFPNITEAAGIHSNNMRGYKKHPVRDSWYAFEGTGLVWEVPNNPAATDADVTLVMNITEQVIQNAELSLQYLTFSPDYNVKPCFYVSYNKASPNVQGPWNEQLSKFCEEDDGTVSELPIFLIERPAGALYHNGGWIGFEPKDFLTPPTAVGTYNLYMSVGDSTLSEKVQDLTTPYGKLLRMTVGPDGLMDNPTDNPFYNADQTDDVQGKVWAYGLRNPYRCSFNTAYTDYPDIWCGVVGEEAVEYIIRVVKANNYGWPVWEGTRCRTDWFKVSDCEALKYTPPVFEWCHEPDSFIPEVCANGADITASYGGPGAAATGGYFYWGKEYSDTKMNGSYIFADYVKQAIMMLTWDGQMWNKTTLYDTTNGLLHPVGIFPDENGELYVVDVPFTTVPSAPQAGFAQIGCGTQCNAAAAVPEPRMSVNNTDVASCPQPYGKDETFPVATSPPTGGATAVATQAAAAPQGLVAGDATCSKGLVSLDPNTKVCCPDFCTDAAGNNVCGAVNCSDSNYIDQCCGVPIMALGHSCRNHDAPCIIPQTRRTLADLMGL